MALIPTASQTVGPYLHLGLTALTRADIAKDASKGEKIVISGQVLDGEGNPIPDALLEFWQANADGKYAHPDDTQDKPLDGSFIGFGRVPTDKDGRFSFATVKPGAVPGPGNSLQAPHIVVCIFMRGMLRHLYTRIYFSDEAANADDPILGLIEDAARRPTLVAQRQDGRAEYHWNIHMQGLNETVFFDC
ncbi:MAG: protocatechuate 3,4-dioxygenase subunit alpha [Ferrovibrio sp.]|uniref:protocatechuate 3,4-dioxygenase subunit alpha n=1 Tax=Ferrovibrio sp. TaxID=1917215 RepID=UPI00391BF891